MAKWLGKAHGLTVEPGEIIVSAGAKQSLFNAIHAIVDEGDEVIIPTPAWGSYNEIVKMAGGRPVTVPGAAENNFVPSISDIEKAISPRTKAILYSSPCNPTGAMLDEQTIRSIADLAVKHDFWIITDDIYRTLIYGDARFFQPATISPAVRAHTVIVDGVSKSFAMTGWRIGFACAPKPLVEAMGTLQGQSTTNAAAVSQAAALAAVEGPTDELEAMRLEFDRRRKVMVKALREIPGVTCVDPRGAFYAFPNLTAFIGRKTPEGKRIDNDGQLCEYLIEAARVAVVPGSAFGAPGYVRLSYATSMKNVEEGVARIAAALPRLV